MEIVTLDLIIPYIPSKNFARSRNLPRWLSYVGILRRDSNDFLVITGGVVNIGCVCFKHTGGYLLSCWVYNLECLLLLAGTKSPLIKSRFSMGSFLSSPTLPKTTGAIIIDISDVLGFKVPVWLGTIDREVKVSLTII